jgi:hypothetical protein
MAYISKREQNQKRYAQFVEKCQSTRNSDDLLALMKEYASSFSVAKNLREDILSSPVVVKKKTKYLHDYMGKDLYVFGTKDGMVIHVDTKPFEVASLKRDEVYWHNLETYSIMKKEAKRLSKKGKKIDLSDVDFDNDEDSVLELQEHLEDSLYTALMVFENNPEGGTQACSDMEEILEKCLKNINGVVITIGNVYTQGNITFSRISRNGRELHWEIDAEMENDGIGKIVYVGAHLVKDRNEGMGDVDW